MSSFRRDYITKPIFSWAHGVLPSMSDTEREALEAGDVLVGCRPLHRQSRLVEAARPEAGGTDSGGEQFPRRSG